MGFIRLSFLGESFTLPRVGQCIKKKKKKVRLYINKNTSRHFQLIFLALSVMPVNHNICVLSEAECICHVKERLKRFLRFERERERETILYVH